MVPRAAAAVLFLACVCARPAFGSGQGPGDGAECVVLLHGLARTERSMAPMAAHLEARGFVTANVAYPSTEQPIEALAPDAVARGLRACETVAGAAGLARVHFVTHSMGGILVRVALAREQPELLGRVVMLAPPNQGSEIVDELGALALFEVINGPAGLQLGTSGESVPNQLGAVDFPVGIIAGIRSLNPWLSSYLDGPDDGKVSVARTKLEGMADFVVVDATHTFIMRDDEARRQTVRFLRTGRFDHGHASP